jgi:hypothetical protein
MEFIIFSLYSRFFLSILLWGIFPSQIDPSLTAAFVASFEAVIPPVGYATYFLTPSTTHDTAAVSTHQEAEQVCIVYHYYDLLLSAIEYLPMQSSGCHRGIGSSVHRGLRIHGKTRCHD